MRGDGWGLMAMYLLCVFRCQGRRDMGDAARGLGGLAAPGFPMGRTGRGTSQGTGGQGGGRRADADMYRTGVGSSFYGCGVLYSIWTGHWCGGR